MKKTLLLFVFFLAPFVFACPTGTHGLSPAQLKKLKKNLQTSTAAHSQSHKRSLAGATMPVLPTAADAQPWGGKEGAKDPQKKWRPEAIFANAVSRELNRAWQNTGVVDAVVSAPLKMINTAERVYGDGQTNATLSWGDGWQASEPQMTATLTRLQNGERQVSFWFSNQVSIPSQEIVLITYNANENFKRQPDQALTLKKESSGLRADWVVPTTTQFGDVTSSHVIWVKPKAWDSVFPIDFRMPVYSTADLVKAAGPSRTVGLSPLDPLQIGQRSKNETKSSELVLLENSYSSAWKKNDSGGNVFHNDSIHGEFHRVQPAAADPGKACNCKVHPSNENCPGSSVDTIKTAVGGGLTWFVERGADSTFKNLYTCFDPRSPAQEAKFSVPSGGGWHEIGDAAETVINSIESAPVLVGFATGLPWPTPPDQLKFAWGLSDVASVRLLQPGEGLVTPAGDRTWDEDKNFRQNQNPCSRGSEPSGGGRNYHWFAFQSDAPVCTQEWVHNCRPNGKDLGLSCK